MSRAYFDWRFADLQTRSARFQAFLHAHERKIASDLAQHSNNEDNLYAFLAELEFAYLILQNPALSISYLPQRSGVRTPDFAVSDSTILFHAEVKHIGLTATERKLHNFERRLKEQVEALPSHLSIYMSILELNTTVFTGWDSFLEFGLARIPAIAAQIASIVKDAEHNLKSGDYIEEIMLDDAYEMLSVAVSRPAGKTDNNTDFAVTSYPVFFKQTEEKKLVDLVIDNTDQLSPDLPNLFYVRADNDTFDSSTASRVAREYLNPSDVAAVDLMNRKLRGRGVDRTTFAAFFPRMSALCFRCNWGDPEKRSFVWPNPIASQPLPQHVLDHLHTMD